MCPNEVEIAVQNSGAIFQERGDVARTSTHEGTKRCAAVLESHAAIDLRLPDSLFYALDHTGQWQLSEQERHSCVVLCDCKQTRANVQIFARIVQPIEKEVVVPTADSHQDDEIST